MQVIKTAVQQVLKLVAGDKEYTVEFPLTSVMKAEDKLGRSLKGPSDWFGAQTKDIPVLLWAGLLKHHPDVDLEDAQEICEGFNAEMCAEVLDALGALNFPKWLERFKESLEKSKKRPNVPSVAAS